MIDFDFIINIIVIIIVAIGLFFFFTATIGLLRFPDFYCKLQATGKGDTLGAVLILFGIVIYILKEDFSLSTILVSIKIFFIIFFIFLANPTATHALTKAGLDSGVIPLKKEVFKK
ncbi:MAG: monovalent cation/H(+) antiporter subunit G [Thermodesulfovibrio sp.]|nr:monovalent cation/H(+) antiporter subunit G [Thermodesulfovibrio sp.]MCX7988363.1 monovalent cation/H(+) antiporter subunit G [Thermodesulfovibrio sp.]MDW7998424.1 monovalent cation/H(+) antiporter subunit G [Thermodesulfovibrio sp.]